MNQIAVILLSLACTFNGIAALSVDESDLIRLPLIPRRRRAADENGLIKIDTDNWYHVRYGVPVEIGTPPQKFSVLLDSGSSDLWVSSKKSKNDKAKSLFDETASSTYQKGPGKFFLGYAGASVDGDIAIETVSLAGLTVTNQPFGLAHSVTRGSPEPYDGIMGISYPSVAQTDNITIIDRLYDQGQIKKRISCVKLRKDEETKSEFILGGCDVETDKWIPVLKINDQYTGWRVNLTKVVLRSQTDNSELLTVETNNEAVLDTGTGNTIDMPVKFLNKINDQLAATWNGEHFIVDCANRTSLPNVDFHFGEVVFTMTLYDYSLVYFDECQTKFNSGGDDFLFGDAFFNLATVIFDKEQNQIGLAPL